MKKHDIRLYNLIFPVWLIWLIPTVLIIVLPANFLLDFLVVFLTMKHLNILARREKLRSCIWKIWLFGFVSDLIGTAFLLLATEISPGTDTAFGKWWYTHLTEAVSTNPFSNLFSILWVAAGVIIAGCCIYFFNLKVSFRKMDASEIQKKKLAASLAVFTAPYLFFLPTSIFYH